MMEKLLKQCEEVALNPKKSLEHYVKEKHMKAIGLGPLFTPAELVDAAGMLPIGLWGGYGVDLDKSKEFFPAFCASMVFIILENGMNKTFESLSAVILPGMTDTLICLGENWKYAVPEIPLINIVYPQNRRLQCGVDFLKNELNNVKKKLEAIKGSPITEEDMQASIELYNKHRKAMREFSELASTHPNTIDNKARSHVFKSAHFMTKKDHLEIVSQINEELKKLPEEKYAGKRVVVTGILMDEPKLLEVLEDNQLRIVGDMLAHETMQYLTDVPADGEDAITRIANQWRDIEGFVVAFDPKRVRGIMMGELAKQREADGALFALMKFSDAEEYDMPICLQDIQDAGFPVLSFEFDQQDGTSEQVKTRIQTFAEIL